MALFTLILNVEGMPDDADISARIATLLEAAARGFANAPLPDAIVHAFAVIRDSRDGRAVGVATLEPNRAPVH